MHDLDLLSRSLVAILFLSVTLLCLVNTLVWEWLQLETPNRVCRHLLWRPWTSLIMHDIDILSKSLAAILFPSVTLLCLVNTLVWEWLQLETPNRVCRHLFWRPWTSLIIHDLGLLSRTLAAIFFLCVRPSGDYEHSSWRTAWATVFKFKTKIPYMKPLDKFTHAWPWPTFKVTCGHFGLAWDRNGGWDGQAGAAIMWMLTFQNGGSK